MSRRITTLQQHTDRGEAETSLREQPRWVIIRDGVKPVSALRAADLARALETNPEAKTFDLLQIPADRLEVAPIAMEATLKEAQETMDSTGAELLYVTRPAAPGISHIFGVLTREAIEESYRH
ncbi:MAG: hypothetical protein GY731_13270 [Gammaproteobacteria bacterium]|nr:hypothetical protein [Gammaproteobacteria bacterium]